MKAMRFICHHAKNPNRKFRIGGRYKARCGRVVVNKKKLIFCLWRMCKSCQKAKR